MKTKSDSTRRNFLKASTAAAGAAIAFPSVPLGKPDSRKLKIGFIGCGGRGTGAAAQALTADSNVQLWAMGEVFRDRLDRSLRSVSKGRESKVNVDEKRKFVGLNAYEKVLDSGVDLVILTTPPGFRPLHFKAAVEANKHIFLEKPMATDAPGLRSVMKSSELAKKKGLAVVAGFCWRYEPGRREFFKRIADGAIGDVQAMYATYYTGPVKPMPPGIESNSATRTPSAVTMRSGRRTAGRCDLTRLRRASSMARSDLPTSRYSCTKEGCRPFTL